MSLKPIEKTIVDFLRRVIVGRDYKYQVERIALPWSEYLPQELFDFLDEDPIEWDEDLLSDVQDNLQNYFEKKIENEKWEGVEIPDNYNEKQLFDNYEKKQREESREIREKREREEKEWQERIFQALSVEDLVHTFPKDVLFHCSKKGCFKIYDTEPEEVIIEEVTFHFKKEIRFYKLVPLYDTVYTYTILFPPASGIKKIEHAIGCPCTKKQEAWGKQVNAILQSAGFFPLEQFSSYSISEIPASSLYGESLREAESLESLLSTGLEEMDPPEKEEKRDMKARHAALYSYYHQFEQPLEDGTLPPQTRKKLEWMASQTVKVERDTEKMIRDLYFKQDKALFDKLCAVPWENYLPKEIQKLLQEREIPVSDPYYAHRSGQIWSVPFSPISFGTFTVTKTWQLSLSRLHPLFQYAFFYGFECFDPLWQEEIYWDRLTGVLDYFDEKNDRDEAFYNSITDLFFKHFSFRDTAVSSLGAVHGLKKKAILGGAFHHAPNFSDLFFTGDETIQNCG